jgi:hypothetical protein
MAAAGFMILQMLLLLNRYYVFLAASANPIPQFILTPLQLNIRSFWSSLPVIMRLQPL